MTSNVNLDIYPMCERQLLTKIPADDFWEVFFNYSAQNPMTIRERRQLRKWIKSSNNPFCNPWGICDENGYEISFIDAYRTILEHENDIDDYLDFDDSYDSKGEEDIPF